MIPICRAPKRFVAALNKERALARFFSNNSRSLVSMQYFPATRPVQNLCALQLSKRSLSTEPQIKETATIEVMKEDGPSKSLYADSMPLTGPRTAEWWTGKVPENCPGYEPSLRQLYSLPQISFDPYIITKDSLRAYFDNTWTLTETLLASLQGEDAFMRSPYHNLRHPMIFYYGHPAAVYVNKLRVAGLLPGPINAYFESIFETGVDEMSWDDLSKNKMPWPSVKEVRDYRKIVYETICKLIDGLSASELANIDQKSPLWAFFLGFEHERIHLETSSFLINELPMRYVRFPESFPHYHPSRMTINRKNQVLTPIAGVHFPVNEMVDVAETTVSIGKPRDFPTFGWDNEYGFRSFKVPAFRASRFKISNGEYLEFVKEGGYATRSFWTDIGWKWRAFRNVKWPTMWLRTGPQGHHEYDLRLIFDESPMIWNWPVCVNYHEAVAFAKWKSQKTGLNYRILTELEHRAIRNPPSEGTTGSIEDDHAVQFGGVDIVDKAHVNANLAYSSMSPVDAMPLNTKGFADVFGNAWEWTEDYFCPLPGFEVHPHYEDFSTPCFDGLHNVIMGGSFISTGNEASIHSRFHFRPHFYQHASFRLVEQLNEEIVTSDTDAPGPFVGDYPFRRSTASMKESVRASNQSDSDAQFNAMLSLHYGHVHGVFAQILHLHKSVSAFAPLTEKLVKSAELLGIPMKSATVIDVGCAAGGLSYQLAKHAHTIVGIDHNLDAIDFAKSLQSETTSSSLKYALKGEGELTESHAIVKPSDLIAKNIEFRCADPMCLPAELKGFDVVILHDVLDKVSAPNSVLGRLSGVRGLVRPGGMLAILSAFQWNAQRTPRQLWLGGFVNESTSETVHSADELVRKLSANNKETGSDFALHEQSTLPLVWHDSEGSIRGKSLSLFIFKRNA